MIKEYLFAALLYDQERRCLRCTLCGHDVPSTSKMARVNGRWVCFNCVKSGKLPYSEPMLAATLAEIATQ